MTLLRFCGRRFLDATLERPLGSSLGRSSYVGCDLLRGRVPAERSKPWAPRGLQPQGVYAVNSRGLVSIEDEGVAEILLEVAYGFGRVADDRGRDNRSEKPFGRCLALGRKATLRTTECSDAIRVHLLDGLRGVPRTLGRIRAGAGPTRPDSTAPFLHACGQTFYLATR